MHENVSDALVEKIVKRVQCGMGVLFLHSAHMSKPFRRLLGTGCTLKWRDNDRERLGARPRTPLRRGCPNISSLPKKKCTANTLIFPRPTSWCL